MGFLAYIFRYFQSFNNPRNVQEKVLSSIIRKNQNTVYGRKYSFSQISSIHDFQEKVPLITYDDISTYIDRMTAGEKNVLTSFDVKHFCATSGTSGKKKFLPVTSERVQAMRVELAVRGLRARKIFKDNWTVIFGPILYICGSYHEGNTESNIPYGSISGYLGKKAPKISRDKFAIPIEVFEELDYSKKISEMAYHALLSDIRHMGFTTTIEVLMLFDYIEQHREELLKRIEDTHPRRARYLRSLPELTPQYIWPNIKLANCFLTDSSRFYLRRLEGRLGRSIHIRDAGINASEGRISLGVCEDDISGLPTAFNTFFEFIDKENPQKILTLDQVETGSRYEVVMTTYEGLYRYRTGDVVEVTYREKKLPAIKFYERENYLDVIGELSPEKELVAAFQKIMIDFKLSVEGFTFLPWMMHDDEIPRYEVLVELSATSKEPECGWEVISEELDTILQDNIHDYYQMRNLLGRMAQPVISILAAGSWKKFNMKRVVESGQPKHIHVVKDPSFRDNFIIEKSYT